MSSRCIAGPSVAASASSGSTPGGIASGGPPSTSTTARTRSGWRVASAVATKPPIEWPVTTASVGAEVVEQRGAVVGVLGDGVRPGQAVAAPAAAQVGRDERRVAAERLGDEAPRAVVGGDPVRRQHERSVA